MEVVLCWEVDFDESEYVNRIISRAIKPIVKITLSLLVTL